MTLKFLGLIPQRISLNALSSASSESYCQMSVNLYEMCEMLDGSKNNLWKYTALFNCKFLFSLVNPCCYYPCQNRGVCVRYGLDRYECDCTRTGYYGENCTIRTYMYVFSIISVYLYLMTVDKSH